MVNPLRTGHAGPGGTDLLSWGKLWIPPDLVTFHPPASRRPYSFGLMGPHPPRGTSIPCPPVSQAEVVLEGRAIRNAHLRAHVWIVQDATVWPASTFPIWGASVFKKHGSPELVEDDGVHSEG